MQISKDLTGKATLARTCSRLLLLAVMIGAANQRALGDAVGYSYTRFVGPVSGPEHETRVTDALNGGRTQVDYVARPDYTFAYGVEDGQTGVLQNRKEVRNGDAVQGVYSVFDPDGTLRVVKYIADDVNGFQAEVITNGVATVHGYPNTGTAAATATANDGKHKNGYWYAVTPPTLAQIDHQVHHELQEQHQQQQQQQQQPQSQPQQQQEQPQQQQKPKNNDDDYDDENSAEGDGDTDGNGVKKTKSSDKDDGDSDGDDDDNDDEDESDSHSGSDSEEGDSYEQAPKHSAHRYERDDDDDEDDSNEYY